MTRTTLVVTGAFVVTQLPFYVVEMLHAIKADQLASARRAAAAAAANITRLSPGSEAEMRVYIWLNVVSKMLVFVSCCINHVIYGLLNHNYSQFFTVDTSNRLSHWLGWGGGLSPRKMPLASPNVETDWSRIRPLIIVRKCSHFLIVSVVKDL